MKYFTKLDNTNKVINVVCVHDNDAPTEQAGIDFLTQLYNYSYWKQSFYDGTRKNPAGTGMQYDSIRDAFIPIKGFNSWVLNEDTCRWEAPTARPDDGELYNWNEETTSWNRRYA
jgi:hypothetical protein